MRDPTRSTRRKQTRITLATRVEVSNLPKICLRFWKVRGAVEKEGTRCHVISCPKFQINFFNVEAWKIWFLAIHVKMADKLKFLEKNRRETTGSLNRRFQIAFKIAVESHANEEKLLRKHCCVSLNASPFLNPRNNEKCFWIFSETLCFRNKCFLRAQMGRHCCVNILRNVFATMFPRWLLEKTRSEGKPTKAPDVEWNMPSTNQITARACWIQLLRAYAREMFSRTANCLASGAVLKAERYSKRLKK